MEEQEKNIGQNETKSDEVMNEEEDHFHINNWDDLLKFTRRNYLKTVEELTKLQEETEQMVKKLISKQTSYNKESTNVVKDWMEMLGESFDKFQKNSQKLLAKASDRATKELNINMPFKKEIEDLVNTVQKNIKSIFEKFSKDIIF